MDNPSAPSDPAASPYRFILRAGNRLIPVIPAFVVYLFAVYMVFHAHGLPDYDYWDMFPSLLSDGGFNLSLGAFYTSSNEHVVALTKIFYLLNYLATGGDNFGLSVIACTFSLIIAACLALVLARSARSRAERICLGLLAAIAAFTPMAAHNFFMGMSGIAWLGANMFAVAAAAMFMLSVNRGSIWTIAVAFLLAFLAGQMYSTGVMAMIAVGIQGLLSDRTRRIGAAFLFCGAVYLLAIYLAQRVPGGHGHRIFDIQALATFSLTFIGAALTNTHSLALLWGGVGIACFLALAYRYLRRQDVGDRAAGAFCIGICVFVFMNAGIAAIGRAGMGGDAFAMASRYASLPSLFWISLLGLALSLRARAADGVSIHGFGLGGATLLGGVLALTAISEAKPRVDALIQRGETKNLAGLALSLGVRDDKTINAFVTPAPSQIYAALPDLRAIHHVPFNHDLGCPSLGSRVQTGPDSTSPVITGHLDFAEAVGDGWFRVRGWALSAQDAQPPLVADSWPADRVLCLALIDANGLVVGSGIGGESRPDVARAYQRGEASFGWNGYANPRISGFLFNGDRKLYAAVKDPSGAWIRLPGNIELSR
ncbi:MAG TPA: hypothetical protein VIT22_09310 [Pseudoxanthomonas sp.]